MICGCLGWQGCDGVRMFRQDGLGWAGWEHVGLARGRLTCSDAGSKFRVAVGCQNQWAHGIMSSVISGVDSLARFQALDGPSTGS